MRWLMSSRVAGLMLAGLALASSARAETVNCTAITTLPYTITVGGLYCLTADLAWGLGSGDAITIETNNVVLDLNGHKLGGLSAGPGTFAQGIYANHRYNITVKNGTVRGFFNGVALADHEAPGENSAGHLIENIRADQNTNIAIYVGGRNSIIRRNQVVSTGGPASGAPAGIGVEGPGNRIIDNDVVTVRDRDGVFGAGIVLSHANNMVVNNRIGDVYNAIDYTGFGSAGAGKYRDNLTSGVTIPYTGGTDAGNNH